MGTPQRKARRARSHANVHGVFILEGDWWNIPSRPVLVKPLFDLIGTMHPTMPVIQRMVATRAEFEHYLQLWRQRRHRKYQVLYLGFHGTRKGIYVGDQRKRPISLDDMATILGPHCEGRLIHFGTCDIAGTDRRNLSRFMRRTGALAVSGFRSEVTWFDSVALELYYFTLIHENPLTRKGLRAVETDLKYEFGPLTTHLRFRLEVSDGD